MFTQLLVIYMSCLLLIAGDELPSCMHCDEGSACFSASKCPPFSVENAGICSCNAGFFMLDDVCVTCTAGFYCAGPHTNTLRRMLSTGADIEACPGNSTSISGSDNSSLFLCLTISYPNTNVIFSYPKHHFHIFCFNFHTFSVRFIFLGFDFIVCNGFFSHTARI